MQIVVGKQTLESLTAGMYSDPSVIYREFIQNAVDSIDKAYGCGLLSPGNETVEISMNIFERQISIFDNGTGVNSSEIECTLISIGNSKKQYGQSRGFRGIGRLAALSYCKMLIFTTSAYGENIVSKVTIDAAGLSELLSVNNSESQSIEDVLSAVCTIEKIPGKASDHFFVVDMIDVDVSSGLLDTDLIAEYLKQVAPLPYNNETFAWGTEIISRLQTYGHTMSQYNIYLTFGTKRQQLYKSYENTFLVDRMKDIKDEIYDIHLHEIRGSDNQLIALAWTAETNYRGTVLDRLVKGIRIRKGNILIGDAQTMNVVFKDSRFNGWTIGEVFILDPQLLPNARRDNFEKNNAYFIFVEKMTIIANEISKTIRAASAKRNTEIASALKKLDDVTDASKKLTAKDSTTSIEKGLITQKINAVQQSIGSINIQNETDKLVQEIAFEELDMIIGHIQGVTSYKALNSLRSLSNTEKKVLEKVFNIIKSSSVLESNTLIDLILTEFSKKISC